jgi:hypothetical protein
MIVAHWGSTRHRLALVIVTSKHFLSLSVQVSVVPSNSLMTSAWNDHCHVWGAQTQSEKPGVQAYGANQSPGNVERTFMRERSETQRAACFYFGIGFACVYFINVC